MDVVASADMGSLVCHQNHCLDFADVVFRTSLFRTGRLSPLTVGDLRWPSHARLHPICDHPLGQTVAHLEQQGDVQ